MKPSEARSMLKAWLKQHPDKTTTDVAALTHVSLKTIDRIVNGETNASRLVIEALQRELGPVSSAE